MTVATNLVLIGASTRAAAYSAARAGLTPWCSDLFGDADLRALCIVLPIPAGQYPEQLEQVFSSAPSGAWMYTGALENHPSLIRRLARMRPLWGNAASILKGVRSPFRVREVLAGQNIPCPDVRPVPSPAASGRWLVKPLTSAGGRGIRFANSGTPGKRGYLQEHIEGMPAAAVFCAFGTSAVLLGVTRQLIGADWLHAAPFHYCGSIGPLPLEPRLQKNLVTLGDVLTRGFGLRGLFGVDFILRDGVPWPVEVNPRYTASVEVHELATGLASLAWHHLACDATAPRPQSLAAPAGRYVGKAILYAKSDLIFPKSGPWLSVLQRPVSLHAIPPFADLPHVGALIPAGRPVLSFFAEADTPSDSLSRLRQTAADLDQLLFDT